MPSGGATVAHAQLRCIRTIYLSDDLAGTDIQKDSWLRVSLPDFAETNGISRRQ
jgi:hypothetical protein